MNVTHAVEVRTTRPVYIENPSRKMFSALTLSGHYLVRTPERVKVVRLSSGKVSIKGLGKGGFSAVHVYDNTRIVFEGENSVTLSEFLSTL